MRGEDQRSEGFFSVGFAQQHGISLDWLMFGDLNGLVETTIKHRLSREETQASQMQEITRLFGMLDDGERHSVLQHIRQIAAMQPRISNG